VRAYKCRECGLRFTYAGARNTHYRAIIERRIIEHYTDAEIAAEVEESVAYVKRVRKALGQRQRRGSKSLARGLVELGQSGAITATDRVKPIPDAAKKSRAPKNQGRLWQDKSTRP